MSKQTRLTEDAAIYQPRQEQTEKQKLRDMPNNEKLSYLWEYYKIHALATVAAVGILIYIIHSIVTPNVETKFYAAIIDNTISNEVWDQYQTEFSNYLKLDPKYENVELNYSFYLNSNDQYATSMQQALSTYVAANEIDVIIAPESAFQSYAYYGFLGKLSDELPTDVYSTLTDQMYLSTTEDDADKAVYGIYLTDTKLFKENAVNTDPYVLGIVVNSKNKENAIEFLKKLYQD